MFLKKKYFKNIIYKIKNKDFHLAMTSLYSLCFEFFIVNNNIFQSSQIFSKFFKV